MGNEDGKKEIILTKKTLVKNNNVHFADVQRPLYTNGEKSMEKCEKKVFLHLTWAICQIFFTGL